MNNKIISSTGTSFRSHNIIYVHMLSVTSHNVSTYIQNRVIFTCNETYPHTENIPADRSANSFSWSVYLIVMHVRVCTGPRYSIKET